MNWMAILYICITIAYGEAMYQRGKHDLYSMIAKTREKYERILEKAKNDISEKD